MPTRGTIMKRRKIDRAHKGAKMTTEIIFWAMNILGGMMRGGKKAQSFLVQHKRLEKGAVKWSLW